MLTTTALYAIFLSIIFLWLSLRVIGFRRRNKIALSDNGDRIMLRRSRVQANFTEYTPLALILLAVAEINGGAGWALHIAGASLLLGRVLHAIGFSSEPDIMPLRVSGMLLTLISFIISIIINISVLTV
ncbi:MAPEG family protein [Parvularcula sp. IMCC14364]|uniref:MAPEG family protein n=1 Tax=Parvularcula sp. IMCC14364 TaxID=3067902 RepID=UPI00274152FE|nr:MAPEG family protein [Parvularcula sp. IMCC14364]